MGEKSYGGATTAAERAERIDYTLRMICERGKTHGVPTLVARHFSCNWKTARKYVRAANALIAADLPTVVNASRLAVRRMLTDMIYEAENDTVKLAAIKQLVDLLGLAAPHRVEASVTATAPIDPIKAYQADHELRDRALQLERDIANGISAHAGDFGQAGYPRLAVPPAPPSSGNGRNGNSH